uniref:Uncharacterized protein n=1 Tax=Solanum tuberosum TaxID=4113 RepID=M1AB19_SOLTU
MDDLGSIFRPWDSTWHHLAAPRTVPGWKGRWNDTAGTVLNCCCCTYYIVAATIVNVGLSFLGMFWVLFCGRERELGRVGIIWWELAKMGLFKGKWASREEGSF